MPPRQAPLISSAALPCAYMHGLQSLLALLPADGPDGPYMCQAGTYLGVVRHSRTGYDLGLVWHSRTGYDLGLVWHSRTGYDLGLVWHSRAGYDQGLVWSWLDLLPHSLSGLLSHVTKQRSPNTSTRTWQSEHVIPNAAGRTWPGIMAGRIIWLSWCSAFAAWQQTLPWTLPQACSKGVHGA